MDAVVDSINVGMDKSVNFLRYMMVVVIVVATL